MRIAESEYNTSQPHQRVLYGSDRRLEDAESSTDTLLDSEDGDSMNTVEKKVLDRVAEALARLGRGKRLGLTVKDKIGFIRAWSRQHRR